MQSRLLRLIKDFRAHSFSALNLLCSGALANDELRSFTLIWQSVETDTTTSPITINLPQLKELYVSVSGHSSRAAANILGDCRVCTTFDEADTVWGDNRPCVTTDGHRLRVGELDPSW